MPRLTKNARADTVLRHVDLVAQEEARAYGRKLRVFASYLQKWETEQSYNAAVLELAAAFRIGQQKAASELESARRLKDNLTYLSFMLNDGAIYRPVAELFLQLTRACSDEVQLEVERRIADRLLTDNVADLRRRILDLVVQVEAEIDPELTRERLDRAARERRVWIRPADDGMCEVTALLEVVQGRRWSLDFEELVRAQKIADERNGTERTADQRRADVFAELPSRLVALLRTLADGTVGKLQELARLSPDELADLEQLAAGTSDLLPAEDQTDQALARSDAPPAAGTTLEDRAHELTFQELAIRCLQSRPSSPSRMLIHVSMSTLLDLDERSGRIDQGTGELGSLPARRVRDLVPHYDVQRVYVDPETGVPLGIDPEVVPALVPPQREPSSPTERAAWLLDLLSTEQGLPHDAGDADDVDAVFARIAQPNAEHVQEELAVLVDHAFDEALREQQTRDRWQRESALLRQSRQRQPSDGAAQVSETARPEDVRSMLLGLLTPARLEDVAEPQHDPTTGLKRTVNLVFQRCTGPGCTRAAISCHRDHRKEYPLGVTALWNLDPKTARCHLVKHTKGWSNWLDEVTGTSFWRSPSGRTYAKPPVWDRPTPLPTDVHDRTPEPKVPTTPHLPEPDGPLWPRSTCEAKPVQPSRSDGWPDDPPF